MGSDEGRKGVEPRAEMPDMPDYGVVAATWEPLPWSWALERLVPNRNYWIVTVSAAGSPAASPVWGVWDPDSQRFAFAIAPTSRKARNIARNPRVAVLVDDTVESVSVEGAAMVIPADDPTHHERREAWIARYVEKYGPIEPSLTAEFVRENTIVEVTPTRAYAVIERPEEFSTRATRWVF